MSALNIINASSIIGKTSVANLTTSSSTVVSNPLDSNVVIKLNTIFCHNYGNTSSFVTINFQRGSNTVSFANVMAIPTNTTLTLLSKDMCVYLEENDSISAYSSSSNTLAIFASYDQIS